MPPDTDLAVGPNNIVETVNSEIAIFDKSGNALFTQPINSFFSTGNNFISDPRVIYDNFTGRFFMVEMVFNSSDPSTATQSFLDIAISNSSDALAGFAKYQINTTEYDPNYGTLLTDYPTLGWNADGYVITHNMFNFQNNRFAHVQIITISNSLYPSIHDRGNGQDFSLDPVRMHDAVPGGPQWFIESDPSGSSVRFVEMTNPFSAAPTFTDFTVPVPTYADPSQTPPYQPDGTTFRIDDRMLDAAMRKNKLVTAQSISDGSETVARWYVFDLSSATNPVLKDSGNIFAGYGVATYVPAIDIAPDMSLGMSYLESSAREYVSMYVTGRQASDPAGACRAQIKASAGDLDQSQLQPDCQSDWKPASDVVVTAKYPYQISLLGLVVASGWLKSTTTERVE